MPPQVPRHASDLTDQELVAHTEKLVRNGERNQRRVEGEDDVRVPMLILCSL